MCGQVVSRKIFDLNYFFTNLHFGELHILIKIRSEESDMELIKRDLYLNWLIERRENGLIKVVTGVRRCGKLYLLFGLYYQYLLYSSVKV